jgi:hypothetical protein
MEESIEIRCTTEELEALRRRATRLSQTMADYVRSCVRELRE